MATEKTASEINVRFETERYYIFQFIDFLQARSAIHDHDVHEVRGVLRSWGLSTLPMRPEGNRGSQRYSHQECVELLQKINEIRPSLDKAIADLEDFIQRYSLDDVDSEIAPLLAEWTNYLMENYADTVLMRDREEIKGHCRYEFERQSGDSDEKFDETILDKAIDHAIVFRAYRKFKALRDVKQKLGNFHLLTRVAQPDSEINVLRQGFILLMTAFDAAIFDLVRVALRTKFFVLVRSFGKQEKISLQDMAEAGGFEALRDQIIEEQMKKRYIKDLLFMLQNEWKVECVDIAAGDKFERLIEFVLRRNVHVHNRGIVDERYLDEKKNLDGLKAGDPAKIDEQYLELAGRLCRLCVERVAAWADQPSI